jgi:hypothetical protein
VSPLRVALDYVIKKPQLIGGAQLRDTSIVLLRAVRADVR